MKNLGRRSPDTRFSKILPSELRGNQSVDDLFNEFLTAEAYSRAICQKLLTVARKKRGAAWEIRRLAVLMLEHQILKLDPANLDEFDFLLSRLRLKPKGIGRALNREVLKEGYSTTALKAFIPELRRKLQRLDHAHQQIKGRKTSNAALRYFWNCSRYDCRMALARYLFSSEEVVDRILKDLKTSTGVVDRDAERPSFMDKEVAHGLSILPDFEAKILNRLCKSGNIYWVSQTTSSEINSLVEYPLNTVVVVIKPPGSDFEFEIKRAGRKAPHSLNVVYARNGFTVPPSHRLDGGCMQWLLRYEANSASKLSLIYRLVHDHDAPMANYVSRSTIFSVPIAQAQVQTVPYFNEPNAFGSGFDEMRVAMKESVDAFIEESGWKLPPLPGELGLTAHFISHVTPAQTILSGTTSLRLDRLASYLSPNGPKNYFEQGLGISYSQDDGKHLADTLLTEVLGSYRPPKTRYLDHDQYVAAALRVPENRATADRIYRLLVEQIAKFWGTLLAVRGYSRGESFVARNVGLKSFWESGEWKVKIIFMDHDALSIPDYSTQNFLAQNALPEMFQDERYVWGGTNEAQFATSEVGYLRSIYRISDEILEQGRLSSLRVLRETYRKTQRAVMSSPPLRRLFNDQFVNRLPDWDAFVTGYLGLNGDCAAAGAWKKEMKRMFRTRGYRPESYDNHAAAVDKNRIFVEKYRELFAAAESEV